ncbi:MAG: hypothetical protein ACK47B_23840 [Armatimonadota bacterium]
MAAETRATDGAPAVAIDTWQKVTGLGFTFGSLVVAAVVAFNTLVVSPLSARTDRVETRVGDVEKRSLQVERDRSEVLQRLAALEVVMRRVETKIDGR